MDGKLFNLVLALGYIYSIGAVIQLITLWSNLWGIHNDSGTSS